MEPEHIDAWGDEYVVVTGRFSGRGRESGIDLNTPLD
jgi:hypothetical protein